MECINKALNNVSNKFNHVQLLIQHHSINWATSKTSTCESQGNRRDKTIATCNPGLKSLGQYCNIHIFLLFLSSLIKQCSVFEIFLQFSLPPLYTKLKLGKKFWIDASNIVCVVRRGVGPVWIGKRPRNAKVSQDFCPWLWIGAHACSLPLTAG